MTADELARQLVEYVDHVHLSSTSDGWHCFTCTIPSAALADVEVRCGDGVTIVEALRAVLAELE